MSSVESTVIAAERVLIRPFTVAEAPALYAAVDESRRELGEWLDWCRRGYTPACAVAWIERVASAEIWKDSRSLGVFSGDPELRVLGSVGLSQIDWATATGNLGYWIRTSELGKGFAREAAAAMAAYGRSQLGLKRIEVAVHPQNHASLRVARAIGAKEEGLVPSRILFRGAMVQALVFSL